ncbi:MAG: cytochrome c family protein [Pseudomonadota bacterium]
MMDSFEFNKYAMALLGVVFFVMGLTFLSDGIFHADKPEQPGYLVEVEESVGETETADAGPAFEPITAMLASADITKGESVAKKCSACHTFDSGGGNKVGPALYGVVERPIASADGFGYSSALSAFAEAKTWTYEELNGFLWKPKTYVKGTSMGFAGLKKVQDRADIVAYLRSLSSDPAPLPAE